MRKKFRFCVLGGDMRQLHLAQLLLKDGHSVRLFGFDRLEREPIAVPMIHTLDEIAAADCVILPLPAANRSGEVNMLFSAAPLEITELWPHLRPQQILFAGRLTDPLRHSAAVHGLTLYDYYDREELAIANALPTAEGAVQIAMEELSTTIEGTRSLVLGFGRIGKILARKLDALGRGHRRGAGRAGALRQPVSRHFQRDSAVSFPYFPRAC